MDVQISGGKRDDTELNWPATRALAPMWIWMETHGSQLSWICKH